jgi:hypothetical protein
MKCVALVLTDPYPDSFRAPQTIKAVDQQAQGRASVVRIQSVK